MSPPPHPLLTVIFPGALSSGGEGTVSWLSFLPEAERAGDDAEDDAVYVSGMAEQDADSSPAQKNEKNSSKSFQ